MTRDDLTIGEIFRHYGVLDISDNYFIVTEYHRCQCLVGSDHFFSMENIPISTGDLEVIDFSEFLSRFPNFEIPTWMINGNVYLNLEWEYV